MTMVIVLDLRLKQWDRVGYKVVVVVVVLFVDVGDSIFVCFSVTFVVVVVVVYVVFTVVFRCSPSSRRMMPFGSVVARSIITSML